MIQSEGPSFSQAESNWPVKTIWITLIIILGLLFSAGVYVGLSDNNQVQSRTSLPPALATELERGTQLFEQGQLAAAETLYRQLIEDYPVYPQGYNNLAALFALRGDLDKSRILLEQAMTTDSDYTTIYRNLGTIYAEMARDSYGRALQLEPVDLRAQLQILDQQGTAQLVSVEKQTADPPVIAQSTPPAPGTSQQEPVEAPSTAAPAQAVTLPPAATESSQPETQVEPSPAAGTIAAVEPDAVPVPQEEEPQDFIRRWAAAWSAQDADAYFNFYASDYIPPNHKTRSGWEKKRKSRIIRPEFIKVNLDNIKIITRTEDHVELELIQKYRNNRFQDKTKKRFELERQADSWAITGERSLGNVN
ncbi:MAG: hypothetical protein RQ754_07630 [Desulfuromonadales bacterium]|nr:hypothetical protein [Desulfuromonadales bacterium]